MQSAKFRSAHVPGFHVFFGYKAFIHEYFFMVSIFIKHLSLKRGDSVQRLLLLPCPWVPSPFCVEALGWVARTCQPWEQSPSRSWLPIVKAPGCLTGTQPQLREAFVNMYNYVNVKDTSHGCGLLFCPC